MRVSKETHQRTHAAPVHCGAVQETHEHDLGLAHDLRVLTRRRIFRLAGVAGASALVAACAGREAKRPVATAQASTSTGTSADAASCATSAPAETAGPYPGDGSNGPNVLVESGIVRSDIRPSFGSYSGSAEGVPMTIDLTLLDTTKNCAAGTGWPSMCGTATARATTRSTARTPPSRTTCAACRLLTPTG